MNIKTPEQFLDCLDDSGVLSKADLQAARETAAGLSDSQTVARRLAKQGLLSRWQASQILAGKLPAHLGKYKLLDQMGVSESGAAFLAEHEQMERRVVVKTITRADGQTDEAARDFLDEARRLAAIDHRNVIHIFDVDRVGGQYYLVLEYVQGESLQRFVDRKGPLAYEAGAGYIALAASALAAAHERGIHHHRLQPDRLLVDQQGELKILDMGIARLVDPQEDQRAADADTGDVDYVAPEQATGKNKCDQRADVYALGCSLYFVLTGQVPYPDGTRGQRLKARLRRTPPDIRDLRPETPARLAEICARMMATQPRERLTAEQAGRQLNQWLKEHQATRLAATAAAAPDAPRQIIAGDDMDSDGDDVGLESFAIDIETGDLPTQPRETTPAADEPEELLELLDEGNKKTWIIAASVGGAAAVVLLGIMVFLLTRSSDEAADAGPAGSEKTTQESADKQAGPHAAKTEDEPTESDDDDFPTAGAFTHVETTDKPDAAKAKADDQPPAPKKKPATRKKKRAAVEPAKGEAAPQNAKNQPPPAGDKPPAAKTTPTQPAAQPAEPSKTPPPANPLELPADTVSLPAVDSVEPLDLGKAVIKDRSELTIDIEGGDSGHGSKGSFEVGAATGSGNPLVWEIRYNSQKGEEQAIAQLEIADQRLKFNWLPAAATSSDAPFLQNCLLNLGAGETTKAMRLREPQRVKPLQIAVIKSGIKPLPFAQEIDFLPDPASVFIELQVDEGTFGPSKFVPQEGRTDNALPADRGTLMILLGEGEAVGLKMESKTSRNKLLIKATPVLRGLQEGQEQKFEFVKLRQAQSKKSKFTEEMSRGLEKMNKVRDDKQPSKKDTKTLEQIESVFKRLFGTTEANVIELELGKLIAQLEHDNKALMYVEGLVGQLQDVISSGGKKLSLPIELRVYRTIGAAQVNLLETSGWESAGS